MPYIAASAFLFAFLAWLLGAQLLTRPRAKVLPLSRARPQPFARTHRGEQRPGLELMVGRLRVGRQSTRGLARSLLLGRLRALRAADALPGTRVKERGAPG